MAEMSVIGNNNNAIIKTEYQPKAEDNQENVAENQVVEKKRKRKPRVKSVEHVLKMKKNRRDRANDRERGRMHSLNDALETLREVLPNGVEGKMTKIETLRTAYNYIYALSETVKMIDNEPEKIPFMKMDSMNASESSCVPPRTNFNNADLLSTFSAMLASPSLASPGSSDGSEYSSSQYESQFTDSPVYSPHYQGHYYPSDMVTGNYAPALPYNNNKNMYSYGPNQGYQNFVDII